MITCVKLRKSQNKKRCEWKKDLFVGFPDRKGETECETHDGFSICWVMIWV